MKYYITKTVDGITYYRKNKTIEGWCRNKILAWRFSKQGARKIIKRYEEALMESWKNKVSYNMEPAE